MKSFWMSTLCFICVFVFCFAKEVAQANKNLIDPTDVSSVNDDKNEGFFFHPFDLSLINNKEKLRNTTWSPLVSLFLPGFDQWYENQIHGAIFYSGLALTGLVISSQAQGNKKDLNLDDIEKELGRERGRQYQYGSQLFLFSGSLSAYHSFRTSVTTQQERGKFEFLKNTEDVGKLLMSPFDFSLLKRKTVYFPLGGLFVLGIWHFSTDSSSGDQTLSMSDLFYSPAISYNAGVGEEALFRGWMMPQFRQWTGDDQWSNLLTSTLFSLAHIQGEYRFPLSQFLMGYYLGFLTQKNEWTLKESIFLHTWWDVIAFTISYLDYSSNENKARLFLPIYFGVF